MLPYKTEAGPRRQLKQQDKLRPPAPGRVTVVTASLLPLTHLIIASCVQTPLWVGGHDWREHGADNLAQIGWRMTPCLNASTQKSVSETVSLSLMTALATVWPLHTRPWLAPSAQATPSIVNHLGSVTRGNQLQAQYLTLIFITQPTNKFRLHKPQYKADFMTSTSIPSGPASKSQRCP